MKVKIFIVTYNNPKVLNKNLETLFQNHNDFEVTVVNNYSQNFHIDEAYTGKVKVIHNALRPDFSTGHLSRNWNLAIIHAFKDLKNPDCDVLITAQDDVEWQATGIDYLLELLNKYTFITFGGGDCVCAYKVDAIHNIGLWDEHFCNIGYQEADYFMRARLNNGPFSTINDLPHERVFNPEENRAILDTPSGCARGEKYHMDSFNHHNITYAYFSYKWNGGCTHCWDRTWEKVPAEPNVKQFMMYPYFEKDIRNKSIYEVAY